MILVFFFQIFQVVIVKAKVLKAKQSNAERNCIDQFNYVSTTTQGCSLKVEEVFENMEDQALNPAETEKVKWFGSQSYPILVLVQDSMSLVKLSIWE